MPTVQVRPRNTGLQRISDAWPGVGRTEVRPNHGKNEWNVIPIGHPDEAWEPVGGERLMEGAVSTPPRQRKSSLGSLGPKKGLKYSGEVRILFTYLPKL